MLRRYFTSSISLVKLCKQKRNLTSDFEAPEEGGMGASGSKGAPPPPPSPRAASSGSSTAREPTSRLETGVTLAFLRDLPDLFEVRSGAMPQSLTTEQLVFGKSRRNATRPSPLKRCLSQATKKRNWCFVEECEHQGFTHSRHGDPYFLPATHYVVHSWHRNWGQLTEALERFTETRRLNPRDTSFFIDVFSVNQNVPPHRELLPDALAFPSIPEDGPAGADPSSSSATDDDLTAEKFFKTTMDAATKTSLARCNYRVVVAPSSWSKPPAYRRLWCVFELALASAQREFGGDAAGAGGESVPSSPTPRAIKPADSAPPGFDLALVRSEEADLVRSFTATQDVAFEWIGGIDASTASATDKLDETLLREYAEKKFPGGYRLLDAAARDAAAAALASACEHNLRESIDAEDAGAECDMRAALGRLHAYRRRDANASAQFAAEAAKRAAAAATGGPNAPAADASARARCHMNLADSRRQAAVGTRDADARAALEDAAANYSTAFSLIPDTDPVACLALEGKLTTLREMQRLERIEDRDEDALTECRIALGRAYFRHGRMQECSAVMASAVMVLDKKHGRDHPSTVAARDLATRLLGRAPIEDWVGEETGREVERLGGRLADVNV